MTFGNIFQFESPPLNFRCYARRLLNPILKRENRFGFKFNILCISFHQVHQCLLFRLIKTSDIKSFDVCSRHERWNNCSYCSLNLLSSLLSVFDGLDGSLLKRYHLHHLQPELQLELLGLQLQLQLELLGLQLVHR